MELVELYIGVNGGVLHEGDAFTLDGIEWNILQSAAYSNADLITHGGLLYSLI